MKKIWIDELARFKKMSVENQNVWFVTLYHTLTMMARDTYGFELISVSDPVRLRMFNELIQRVSSAHLGFLRKDNQGMPDDDLFELISDYLLTMNENDGFIIGELKAWVPC